MSPILEVNEVRKAFGSTEVLDRISFRMEEGERICLLGPSGCGKSTLLQLVAGLLEADGGEIVMDGRLVNGPGKFVPPEDRPLNMVFQDYALWPHMTVRDNIEYGLRRKKLPVPERNDRIQFMSELLHLEGLMGRMPSELSGGQQQRVGIARAMATAPRILLMDEPLSNLDSKLRTEMRTELAEVMGELSITSIYVTHDMMEAFALADRILVLHAGGIEQLAPPREMYEAPATPWVAELMGYHNRISGRLVGMDGDLGVIQCGDQRIQGVLSKDPKFRPAVEDQVLVMLHPDTVELDETAAISAPAMNRMETRVRRLIYEGERWRSMLETGDGQTLQALHRCEAQRGSERTIAFPVHRTRVYKSEPR